MAATRWCPSCGGEFQANLTTCPDCGVPLEDTPPPPSGEDPYFDEAVAAFAAARAATKVLRIVSLVSFAFWFLGTLSLALELWDAHSEGEPGYFMTGSDNLTSVIAQLAGTGSWGYLIVAVLAYTASVIIDLGRAKDMLEVADREG